MIDVPLFNVINSFAATTPWLHSFLDTYATYGPVLFALLLLGDTR